MVRKIMKPVVGRRRTTMNEGGRPSFADRSSGGRATSEGRSSSGERPSYGERSSGERTSYGERPSYGGRTSSSGRSSSRYGEEVRSRDSRSQRPSGDARKDRFSADNGERKGSSASSSSGFGRSQSSSRSNEFSRNKGPARSSGPSRRSHDRDGFRGGRPSRSMQEQKPREEAPTQDFILGRRAVMEALKAGREINKLLVQENTEGGSFAEILHRAREVGVVVQTVPKAKLDEITQRGAHQGVVAYIAAKAYLELDELIKLALKRKPGLLVMLDGIEDPHNLGSILRSADAAGASGVIIPKRRAVPLTGTVAKASAGALEHIEVARVSNLSQAIDELKEAGFWIIGADAKAPVFHWQADFTMPTVLVIGNEGDGLARLTTERCDLLVKLPMQGQVDSLNAGVATGILLYEAVRQRAGSKLR